MSQQREMIVTRELDAPQGDGWKLAHVRGNDEDSPLVFIWVREPVPDAWQDFSGPSGYMMFDDCGDPLPSGFEPMGPWKQFTAHTVAEADETLGTRFHVATHWRRPLRRIESETLALPDSWEEFTSDANHVRVFRCTSPGCDEFAAITKGGIEGWATAHDTSQHFAKTPPLAVVRYLLARYAQLNGGAA